jgi:hypothetical protein
MDINILHLKQKVGYLSSESDDSECDEPLVKSMPLESPQKRISSPMRQERVSSPIPQKRVSSPMPQKRVSTSPTKKRRISDDILFPSKVTQLQDILFDMNYSDARKVQEIKKLYNLTSEDNTIRFAI